MSGAVALSGSPESIGRYRIEGVLGRGAMGVIYRAHDPEIDRRVAIKLIRADLLDGKERAEYLERFRREAQAAGRCSHPNIVAVYDFAMHGGNPFLAMEFVDGISLGQAYERGTNFTVTDAIALMQQILGALGAAHATGVVHRDIKPANILLASGNFVKVTDFGISRVGGAGLTQAGALIGTPSYMSPEQCRGEVVDGRSDLFSAGVVFYEMLAGQRPFPGRSFEEVWHRLMHEAPADITTLNAGVSAALKRVVGRALAKTADARFASAAEMAAALTAAAGEGVVDEATVIRPMPAPVSGSAFDAAVVSTIERTLTQYVGPIAHVLVQSAIRRVDSIEALSASLAGSITRAGERELFIAEVNRQFGGGVTQQRPAVAAVRQLEISAAERARVQTELTRYIGPVANVLVQREMAKAESVADLWDRLARRIEREDERRAFLGKRGLCGRP
ncbi:MAG TPA: serine/threonine-protein kinase [Acetobacteraceae bacterium]